MDSLREWCEHINEYLVDGKDHLSVTPHSELEVGYGFANDFNRDYCDAHNIPYYCEQRDGGAIVYTTGSITIGVIYSHDDYRNMMLFDLLDNIADLIKERGYEVSRDNNDILVNGYKVASCCGSNLPPNNRRCYEGAQISLTQDLEAIRNICIKPMEKEPKGLSEFGFTYEEVLNHVYLWINTHTKFKI